MLPFHTLDVFTQTPFSGNPLAVVLEAEDLSTAQMQTLAREFNLSETIFVRPPADPAHTAEVRIFFPTAEIPFAGHPTIGCAILLAEIINGDGDWTMDVTLEEQAGLVPVKVTRQGGQSRAEFTAPVIPHAPKRPCPTATEIAALAPSALGLGPADIGFGGHVPGLWSGGPTFLYIPVASRTALGRAQPQEPAWTKMISACGVDNAYLYTPGEGADFQARMFSPTAGIPEDPATGSASALLAAQLLACGALHDGTTSLTLHQGMEMGRPSHIGLTVDVANGAITAVRIAGGAVQISMGSVAIPQRVSANGEN